MDKNIYSYVGPRFDLQNPLGSSKLAITQVLRGLTHSSDLHGHQPCMHVVHMYMNADYTLKHIKRARFIYPDYLG